MVAAGAGTAKEQQQDDLGTRPGSRRTATSAGAGTATVVRGHKQAVAAAALAAETAEEATCTASTVAGEEAVAPGEKTRRLCSREDRGRRGDLMVGAAGSDRLAGTAAQC